MNKQNFQKKKEKIINLVETVFNFLFFSKNQSVRWVLVPVLFFLLSLGSFLSRVYLASGSVVEIIQTYPLSFLLAIFLCPLYYLVSRYYYQAAAKEDVDYFTFFARGLFLLSLFFITLGLFDLKIGGENLTKGLDLTGFNHLGKFFLLFLGFTFFCKNKAAFKQRIRREKEEKRKAEEKRAREFAARHPFLAEIPLVGSFLQLCSREGWGYCLVLAILLLVSSGILTYQLGEHEFKEDEHQVVDAAGCYYYEQEFCRWDWIKMQPSEEMYTRAWPHSWLIAQSYTLFGISEWSSRLVSVVFGVGFVFILYLVTRFFTESKKIALLTSAAAVFYPSYIGTFRYTRMYALLIPLFSVLVYLLYKGLTGTSQVANLGLGKWVKNLDLNYLYLGLFLALLWLNKTIHYNALVILPAGLVFVLVMAFLTKEKKYKNLALLGLLASVLIFLAYFFGLTDRFLGHLCFFGRSNYSYIKNLISYPFGPTLGYFLFALSFFFFTFFPRRLKDKFIYLYCLLLFSWFFFIYIGDRYYTFLYFSHFTPFLLIILITSFFMFSYLFRKKVTKGAFLVLLFAFLASNFTQNVDAIYETDTSYGKYRQAYQVIIDRYDPEKDVIFGQYLRKYYLQELPENTKTIDMERRKSYEFDTFIQDLQEYKSGFITWETRKGGHLVEEIKDYVAANFQKLHGEGIDKTRVEVYYFDETMYP